MARLLHAALLVPLAAAPAGASQLVADLSQRQVSITAGFTGTELVLFGTTSGPNDVVVVLRGPEKSATVRRKARKAGIWINDDRAVFGNAPAMVWLGASRELAEASIPDLLGAHDIGADFLSPEPAAATPDLDRFREAFLRRKQAAGLYPDRFEPVRFIGERLFRASISFPANVPIGSFRIEVFEIRDDAVVNATATALHVRKAGIEAAIHEFAHGFPILHGLVAILMALVAGWLAGAVNRRS